MELIRDLHAGAPARDGCVAAIGTFDGVHLGHQSVIRQAARFARRLGRPLRVVTFEPQPQEYFSPESAPARLTSFREKFNALRGLPVDGMCCLRFGPALSALEPEQFVERLLVRGLGVEGIVVGDDFRFGRDRRGDFETLVRLSHDGRFCVEPVETRIMDGERISSSRIRSALRTGDLESAEAMLGRPYAISGRVQAGDRRGRELGFPTVNIDLTRRKSPVLGIFVVSVEFPGGESRHGVASVGTRPMFDGRSLLLEVHILDFSGDLYGQRLNVQFLHRLRNEENFKTVEQLQGQVRDDIAQARAFISKI